MAVKLYAERDVSSPELMDHYLRHVDHMTTEELFGKGDIAAELAWRDHLLAASQAQVAALQARCEAVERMLRNSVSCVRDYATSRRMTGHSATAKFYDEMANAIDALLADVPTVGVG